MGHFQRVGCVIWLWSNLIDDPGREVGQAGVVGGDLYNKSEQATGHTTLRTVLEINREQNVLFLFSSTALRMSQQSLIYYAGLSI